MRSLSIIQPLTVAPLQSLPMANATTNDNTPYFSWQSVVWGSVYQIQIDNNSTFASPERDVSGAVGLLNFTPTLLPDGIYYWRVRAWNSNSPTEAGAWSASRKFTIGNYP